MCSRANARIKREIVAGRMKPATTLACHDCERPANVYDHRSYLRPLDVVPVCWACNVKRGPSDDFKAVQMALSA
jgi:hypothetical protein